MKPYILFILLLSGLVIGCSGEEDFLHGYDREELFAPPSAGELAAVRSDWQTRDLAPSGYAVQERIEIPDHGLILKLISYTVGGFKEYAAVLVPESGENVPVRMFINGFAKGLTTNSVTVAMGEADTISYILAIPSLRGQSLQLMIDGATYATPIAGGVHCDAFDGATDDAIALLNIIETTEEQASVSRTAVRGGSRGGTVALLMAERDQRVKYAISVAGPAELLELTSHHENDETYQCQFLDDLVSGAESIPEARHTLIASSPLYFAEDLPVTQLHLAAEDHIVPVGQGDALADYMNAHGAGDRFSLFVYPGKTHENIVRDNPQLVGRIDSLLSKL